MFGICNCSCTRRNKQQLLFTTRSFSLLFSASPQQFNPFFLSEKLLAVAPETVHGKPLKSLFFYPRLLTNGKKMKGLCCSAQGGFSSLLYPDGLSRQRGMLPFFFCLHFLAVQNIKGGTTRKNQPTLAIINCKSRQQVVVKKRSR